MEIKVIHYTRDALNTENAEEINVEHMLTLGGREAGICYAADSYFSKNIHNSEAAQKRANTIIGTGHHSPFDHATIGLEITGIPKIVAMILNSTEFYTTSEKSARYTIMKPDTEKEEILYNKWREIFNKMISNLNIDATEKEIDKLAIENARYMLSVFTLTSMGFTTTFRQFSYLSQWLGDLNNFCLNNLNNPFYKRLQPYIAELQNEFGKLTNNSITDHKSGRIRLLPETQGDIPDNDIFFKGNMYQTEYFGSFAHFAQAQRHRTIHYEMYFNTEHPEKNDCYIPKILRGTTLEKEWIEDFKSIADVYPQCTLVKFMEQGEIYWFCMKCRERLCGRAQLEIAEQTKQTLELMIKNINNISPEARHEIMSVTDEFKIVPKCGFPGYKCKEPCRWGKQHGIDRII